MQWWRTLYSLDASSVLLHLFLPLKSTMFDILGLSKQSWCVEFAICIVRFVSFRRTLGVPLRRVFHNVRWFCWSQSCLLILQLLSRAVCLDTGHMYTICVLFLLCTLVIGLFFPIFSLLFRYMLFLPGFLSWAGDSLAGPVVRGVFRELIRRSNQFVRSD